jgi:hypothetical protein
MDGAARAGTLSNLRSSGVAPASDRAPRTHSAGFEKAQNTRSPRVPLGTPFAVNHLRRLLARKIHGTATTRSAR